MTAKSYLSQIRKCDTLIRNKLQEVQSLKELILSVTSVLKDDVVSGGGDSDKVGTIVCKIVELQEEINEQIDRLVDLKDEAMKIIDGINGALCDVLYRRYFCYETWEQIAVGMGYTYQWVCKLHGKALLEVDKLLKEREIVERDGVECGAGV